MGWPQALSLLDEMKSVSIKPDVVSVTSAVSACGNGHAWRRAVELSRTMLAESIEPNTVGYTAAISAASKSGKWHLVLSVMDELARKGHAANVVTYSAAISALEKANQWVCALDMWRTMRENMVEPNHVAYTAALDACSKGRQPQYALQLREEMKQKGMYTSRGRSQQQTAVLESMRRDHAGTAEIHRQQRADLRPSTFPARRPLRDEPVQCCDKQQQTLPLAGFRVWHLIFLVVICELAINHAVRVFWEA